MNIAVILAGGVGHRMGANIPKQFIEVLGKPVLVYTLEKFQENIDIDIIEIVCVNGYIDKIWEYAKKYNISKLKYVVSGGDTFQDSVRNGIFNLKEVCHKDDIVIIHMSVAPFIDNEIISDSINVCSRYGNGISANKCLLCMCTINNAGTTNEPVDRDTLIGLNTPQSFKFEKLLRAYEYYSNNICKDIEPHTTSLMFAVGETLHFSKGSQMNIKITTPDDIDLFEAYLLMCNNRKQQK